MTSVFEHPWLSGLFGDEEISKILSANAELQRMLQIEAAWTRAVGKVENNIDAEMIADKILSLNIKPEDLYLGAAQDGMPVPSLVNHIKSELSECDPNFIHKGLTSQDIIDTALVLALREIGVIILERIKNLDKALQHLEGQVGSNELMAYTRMQPALTLTSKTKVQTWRQPFPKLILDIEAALTELSVIQYGGPIGVRSHSKAGQLGDVFAHNLGLKDPGSAWHVDRTRLTEFAALLARVTIATGKIGSDICQLASLGKEYIALAAGGKSSVMKHKNNPIKAELLVSLADYSAIQLGGLYKAGVHEHERSGRAWTLEWMLMPALLMACGRSASAATDVINSIETLGCSS